MLLKFFPGGSTSRDNGILEWLDYHAECHPNCYSSDLGGDPGFTLHTDDAFPDELESAKQNYSEKIEKKYSRESDVYKWLVEGRRPA